MATITRARSGGTVFGERRTFQAGGYLNALDTVARRNGRDFEAVKADEARALRRRLRRLPRITAERRLSDEQVAEQAHYFELALKAERAVAA